MPTEIHVECPLCKQSVKVTDEIADELIDCPKCKGIIDVAATRVTSKAEIPTRSPTPISESASVATANALPKILSVLVIIAVMIGCYFAYNFWKDQQRAKAEEPFFVAAKEALDEAHKLQSALGVGLTYLKYGDDLILLAAKVDNLLRAAVDTGIENLRPEAKVFCQHLLAARESFKSARGWWELKIKYPNSDNTEEEKKLQEDWAAASKAIDASARVYSTLKNH